MQYKLLLADDSLTIQKVVELVLANENFEIKSASDGQTAWNLMSTFKPDIVLADIDMPNLNGYDLCSKIKNDMSYAEVPVILLAGAFEPFDEEKSKEVLADDYIIKPFESQELISKVKALVSNKAPRDVDVQPDTSSSPQQEEDISWNSAFAEQESKTQQVDTEEDVIDKSFADELQMALDSEPAQQEDLTQDDNDTPAKALPIPETSEHRIENQADELFAPVKGEIADIIKEAIKEAVTKMIQRDLQDEIRAFIKTAVPEIAEKIITKEIEKITSGMK